MKEWMEFKYRDMLVGGLDQIDDHARAALATARQANKLLCLVLDERGVRVAPHEATIVDIRASIVPVRYAHVVVIRTTDGKEYVLKDPLGIKERK